MEIMANVPVELLTLVLLAPEGLQRYFQSSVELAHVLPKTYFSWKQASPPENMSKTENPYGSSWWDVE